MILDGQDKIETVCILDEIPVGNMKNISGFPKSNKKGEGHEERFFWICSTINKEHVPK